MHFNEAWGSLHIYLGSIGICTLGKVDERLPVCSGLKDWSSYRSSQCMFNCLDYHWKTVVWWSVMYIFCQLRIMLLVRIIDVATLNDFTLVSIYVQSLWCFTFTNGRVPAHIWWIRRCKKWLPLLFGGWASKAVVPEVRRWGEEWIVTFFSFLEEKVRLIELSISAYRPYL